MRLLVLVLLLLGCDAPQDGTHHGGNGQMCYANMTCDEGLVCVHWHRDRDTLSYCAPTDDLNIGGFMAPKCNCPDPPKPVPCPDAGVVLKCPWR
jgi:hypothetical protein